jgi:hypothetical protein
MQCPVGSVVTLMRKKSRHEQAVVREQDRKPDSNRDWLYIGEAPAAPFCATPPSRFAPFLVKSVLRLAPMNEKGMNHCE